MLQCFLPTTKCSDLAVFSPRKCVSWFTYFSRNWIQWSLPWAFLESLLCFLENNWFTKISLLLLFLSLVVIQKEISLFHLGNQGYLFKALSVEFEIFCIIGLKWKEVCFWDNEACAQLICVMCLDFQLCILETPLLLPRCFFLNQSLRVEDENSMKTMEMRWNC